MTIDFLAHKLAEDDAIRESLDYTPVLVNLGDKDGSIVNQVWFGGPFTISNYAQNFFNPAGFHRIEWTSSMEYDSCSFHELMSETEALMELAPVNEAIQREMLTFLRL